MGFGAIPEARAGTPIPVELYWRKGEGEARLPVQMILIFRGEPPAIIDALPFQPFLRRVWERSTGSHYRFGATRMPLEHYFPPFLWKRGEVYRDFFHMWVPVEAAPGLYTLHMTIHEEVFSGNWELRDLIYDDGSLVGPEVGEMEILPGP
jgi:hypothetical protein